MVPNGPPTSPSPSPASAKVSCQGATQIGKKHMFDDFYDLYEKKNSTLPWDFKRGPRESYNRRFPEGVQIQGEKETLNIMLKEKDSYLMQWYGWVQ